MKVENFNHYNEYSFVVSFCVNEIKCIGRLILEPSKLPMLKIESSEGNLHYAEHLDIKDDVLCEEVVGNNSFRLHVCEYLFGVIYPKFVTNGRVFHDSDKIQIFLTGISQWFDGVRGYDYKDDNFTRDISISKVNGSFCYNGETYKIENDRDVNVVSDRSTTHTINIDYSILITKDNGSILFGDLEGIAREIRNLFSILLGVPLSIKYLYLISRNSNARYNSVYLLQHLYDENPLRHSHEAFCPFGYILDSELFPVIVDSFFSKESFRNIWNRLFVIFKGVGAWDLDILSCVVVLEMYSSLVSEGKHHKLNKKMFGELKGRLLEVIDEFAGKPELDAQDIKLIDGIKAGVNGLKNTSFPTLKEKYNYLLDGVSESVKEAVALNEHDFILIKKIRDSVAHGLDYKKIKNDDITEELQLNGRLTLFLMYLAYKELGFNDEQFAFCIAYSHSPISHSNNYNERAVDKLAKTATFINLNEVHNGHYDYYKPIVIWHDLLSDSYKLDEELSNETQKNWPNKIYPDIRDFIRSLTSGPIRIKYLSKVYLTNGEDETLYYSALLLEEDS